jgi:hypothetical protein
MGAVLGAPRPGLGKRDTDTCPLKLSFAQYVLDVTAGAKALPRNKMGFSAG